MDEDSQMPDADGHQTQKHQIVENEAELDVKYPHRPKNTHETLPFHALFQKLFNPLNDNLKKKGAPAPARKKQGLYGQTSLSPHEVRRNIIEKFIANWRKEVGDDFYPALRLILPEKDRDRAMYGLKEKNIARLLIKVMGMNPHSEDANSMINWKIPGTQKPGTNLAAGDFPGRCYEALSKRAIRNGVGDMTIAEVNEELDKLSLIDKREELQLPIFKRFYQRMNPEELTWLIRIILRQMKIGATEKTILDIWHPDAETLFNVSSNLRRVCWELYDPRTRLGGEETGITLMQCFQPQLAAFQNQSFEKTIEKMKPSQEDDTFWIEEKLDGERMQLHMIEDDSVPGGKRFGFWSRKAKDYTYLYGSSFENLGDSSLTRFIKDAFDPGVRNIILDGEMITWDIDVDKFVAFGTLKTAAKEEMKNQANSYTGQRPLYRIFDCLYLNDTLLTSYTLRDRRKALTRSVKDVFRRLEIHPYKEAHNQKDIEEELRGVMAEGGEGLVVKNPRSSYRLNERNDDWCKIKPEYMAEFGESLDCVVVGGYFGSGYRGGAHSSFLCALLVDKNAPEGHPDYERCYSFFKVGGGFSRQDYQDIRQRTEGKWHDWKIKNPPDFLELGGHDQNRQYERPDQWIYPHESVVLEAKAASVGESEQFRMNITLRFPRFRQLRTDKNWRSALSVQEWMDVKDSASKEKEEKEIKYEQSRRKKARTTKKPLVVAGNETVKAAYAGPETKIFEGLTFYIMSSCTKPEKKSRTELEEVVKAHGGNIVQKESNREDLILIADRNVVTAASLIKRGKFNIIRPTWLFDCIKQAEIDIGEPTYLLPFEPERHMLFIRQEDSLTLDENIDDYGDSFARDVTVEELKSIFSGMPSKFDRGSFDPDRFLEQADDHALDLNTLPGFMFHRFTMWFDQPKVNGASLFDEDVRLVLARNVVRFGGGKVVEDLEGGSVTHVVIGQDKSRLKVLREEVASWARMPRIVSVEWVERCWEEKTVLDEERFGVV